jgi:integrase
MRHTMATRLARSGAPLVQTQKILGHSDPKLTARVYQHLGVEGLRHAVAGIGRRARATELAG